MLALPTHHRKRTPMGIDILEIVKVVLRAMPGFTQEFQSTLDNGRINYDDFNKYLQKLVFYRSGEMSIRQYELVQQTRLLLSDFLRLRDQFNEYQQYAFFLDEMPLPSRAEVESGAVK